jgi:hypothetical protein
VDTGVLSVLSRVLEEHSAAISFPVFLIAITVAYWWYGVRPYRRDRLHDLRSPEHICRPAIPGVLEYFASERLETPAQTDPNALIGPATATGTNQQP